jgi:hypothetical protein
MTIVKGMIRLLKKNLTMFKDLLDSFTAKPIAFGIHHINGHMYLNIEKGMSQKIEKILLLKFSLK